MIPAGTKIDKPEDFFEEREWPSGNVPENAIGKMEDLRGKTTTREMFANSFAFKEAFEGTAKKDVVVSNPPKYDLPPGSKETRMVIQYGSGNPQAHRFVDGVLITDGGVPSSPRNNSTSPEIKPEEKEKEEK
jgi:hypothetical protein